MNLDALSLPACRLLPALQARRAQRLQAIAARDALAPHDAERIHITSYMENIGWPELFGFDMNRFLTDPDFSLEMQLRQKIFWADNTDDDTLIDLNIQATTGMYYDMTLFGQRISHTPEGVPVFAPHPLAGAARPEPALIPPFVFYTTGDMPALIAQYRRMCALAQQDAWGNGVLQVSFPCFHRGPLDVMVQMRTFDKFIDDIGECPELVTEFLDMIVAARLRYARERQTFLGDATLPATSFVADDWVNVPFISPTLFRRFALPAYRRIRANEGPVTGFHTCGNFERVVVDLLAAFPDIRRLEVSGWNDIELLDRIVSPQVGFDVSVINTLVLVGSVVEQRTRLEAIERVGRHRRVQLCAQAMVRLNSYAETMARLNAFTRLAYDIFAA